jgi:subtilisin family serine protease
VTSLDPFLDHDLRFPEKPISILVASSYDLTPSDLTVLENFGTLTTVAGPVGVLHTRSNHLADIARLPFISRVEGSHPLLAYLDRSVPDIGADAVWREVKDPQERSVTGAGIIIGFVDTGIDTTHPDFSFPNGTTKILFVWDQTTSGRSPADFDYGYECNSNDIQAKQCPEFDSFGHGTHVAGIAASSGRATGNFTGVAPDAAIIFVKSGHQTCNGTSWTFDTSQILDGINYIAKKAAQLGRRAVINLSLGGNIGGHDGNDPLERGLDAFVRSGTPIVVAAGNSAQDNDHVKGQLSQGMNVTLNISVKETTTDLAIDIWYSPEDEIEAKLITPQGQTYTIPTPSGGATDINGNITAQSSTTDLGQESYLEVNSNASLPAAGWTVSLRANQVYSKGFWDAWIDTSTCSFPGAYFVSGDGYEIDPHLTIGIPGTARNVVTVGAYITKNSWRGVSGETFGRGAYALGQIASFSSLGPTRDGRVKPDVVAPGLFIASARSSVIVASASDPDAFHRINAGTSMAAPHVAGTVALMLQYDPSLEAVEVPRLLRETARLDADTGFLAEGSPIWGYGKADARTATGLFRLTLVIGGIAEDVTVPGRVDDKESLSLLGESWNDIYFPKGTVHTVTLETQLQGEPGTRFTLEDGRFNLTASSTKVVNYTVQHLLTVNSQYGPATGSGWYDANATVRVGAPQSVAAPGLLSYLGAEYVLSYWVTDSGKIIPGSVIMDQPRTVTAVYVLTYPLQTFLLLTLLILLVVVSFIVLTRRRRKTDQSVGATSS